MIEAELSLAGLDQVLLLRTQTKVLSTVQWQTSVPGLTLRAANAGCLDDHHEVSKWQIATALMRPPSAASRVACKTRVLLNLWQ